MKSHISFNQAWVIVGRYHKTPHKTTFRINKHVSVILEPSQNHKDGVVIIVESDDSGFGSYSSEEFKYLAWELHSLINEAMHHHSRGFIDYMNAPCSDCGKVRCWEEDKPCDA